MSGLAACSGSGTNPKGVTQTNISASILQLAVGTANIYGDLGGAGNGSLVGTNVVATYRQPAGSFAGDGVLVNSPTLTLPLKISTKAGSPGSDPTSTIVGAAATSSTAALPGGPAPGEIGGSLITSTAQTQGASTVTSFGVSGNVSALGIEPFNYTNLGVPFTVAPYQVPLYDPLGPADVNSFIPWGGPPAFDPDKNGESIVGSSLYPGGQLGVSEGLDVFANLAPTVGTYSLAAPSLATSGGNFAPTPASFALKSAALLPAITAPVPTVDGAGGATFAVALPAGVSGAYVQVTNVGPDPTAATPPASCDGANPSVPIYYTIYVTASGTATLGDVAGPTGTPSICTSAQNTTADGANTDGDQFSVQIIGFDYPAYASSLPNSLGNPAPALVGAVGQDDVTISSAKSYTQAFGGALAPAATMRRRYSPFAHQVRR